MFAALRQKHIPVTLTPAGRVLLISLLLSTLSVSAEDWPNWMGPRWNGISSETGWSADWPDDGLPQVWTKQIGIGFSSVSVVEGLLYTMGHEGGRETIWCLNSASGQEVWSHSYPAELNANLYEGGPGSTPTVDGASVFALSVDGQLFCLDRIRGTVRWQRNLQQDLEVGLHEWGFNSSPLVLGNQLILQGGRIVSYDKRTGELLWRTRPHQAGYGSVRAFQHAGQTLLASLDCDGLRITVAADGTQVAFFEWPSPFATNSSTPIIVDDTIFISTGYNVGCALLRLKGGTLEPIYTNRQMRNHFNNSILIDGYLYGFDGNSNLGRVVTLTCMDFATGRVQWKQQGLGCGSLMAADNRLIILSEKGKLVLAAADPEKFQLLASSDFLRGRCWTVPVLANGFLFGRNAAGQLVCARLPDR